MNHFTFSILRFAAFLLSIILSGYLIIIGKPILAPLIFSAFLAFLLKPYSAWLENRTGNRMWGVILSILSMLSVIFGLILLFGMQLGKIIGNFDDISKKLNEGLQQGFRLIGNLLGMRGSQVEDWLTDNLSSWADIPTQILTSGLGSSAYVLGSILLCLIFVFFLLLYRTSFYQFLLYQFDEDARKKGGLMMRKVVKITKEYLNGLLLVILILASLNTLGLYIIGIELALFWGILGACLAIIPYIGTTLGGLLPAMYALANYGFTWHPLAVIIFYIFVQSIEGNIITPKVVGKSVRINPFVAILALLIGGALWGIAGMILALPIMAVIKIFMTNVELLQPVSELFRDDLYQREDVFREKYDDDRYRILNYFRRQE
ncbi:AI-2E family transporter [Lewinella cohaerens]|uniref:AI-2E family transporter n=1 Tax=Lewinella cohaerens TaxID=70995 RepID=UPI00036A8A53|nr:AI-2E family transporter [Lewinella cohaerens]